MPQRQVLIVGATGRLGQLIADALLEHPDVRVRCLLRPGALERVPPSLRARVDVVEGAIDGPPALLRQACDGVETVISAVQGGPDIIVDAQLALLAAARSAGVRRFLPSDFSFDFFGLKDGDNVNSDWRRQFAVASERERGAVSVHHVLNGCFIDLGVLFGFLGAFDLQHRVLSIWGDGRAPMDFTTYADAARYTACAALDPSPPSRVAVAGDVLDAWQLKAAVDAGTGATFTVETRGSLDDLDAAISARQRAQPDNLFAWLPLMYWRGMLNGRGKLDALVNARYPTVRPETVQDFAREHRAVLLQR